MIAVRPVARAHYIFHRHRWHIENVPYLQHLYLTARGAGVGRRLIEAVYAPADPAGASPVYWLTEISKGPARRLYDRIGTATPFMKYVR